MCYGTGEVQERPGTVTSTRSKGNDEMGRHSEPDDSAAPGKAGAAYESALREFDELRARYPEAAAIIERVGAAGRRLGSVDLGGCVSGPKPL